MPDSWKPDPKLTGLRLAIARRIRKKSQTQVVDEVPSINKQTTYSTYETGKIMPSITTLNDLAIYLDVDFLWLLGHPAGKDKGPKEV